jgi:hypothetical protein
MNAAEEEKAPNCPICENLAFSAVVGDCGHTICLTCKNKVDNKCPLCNREQTKFRPNFLVRQLLEQDAYKSEMAILRKHYISTTPQGIVNDILNEGKLVMIQNDYDITETSILLKAIQRYAAGDETALKSLDPRLAFAVTVLTPVPDTHFRCLQGLLYQMEVEIVEYGRKVSIFSRVKQFHTNKRRRIDSGVPTTG